MNDEEAMPLVVETTTTTTSPTSTSQRWLKLMVATLAVVGILFAISIVHSTTGYDNDLLISKHHLSLVQKMAIATGTILPMTAGYTSYTKLSDADLEILFTQFKETYGRSYKTEKEESARYLNFVSSMAKIDERNAKVMSVGGTAIHGVGPFADLSDAEMKMKRGLLNTKSSHTGGLQIKTAHVPDHDGLISKSNWVDLYTTTGRDVTTNQGDCGDCWAFSSVNQIESDALRAGVITRDQSLSVQQVVSCDTADNGVSSDYASLGCNGGTISNSYEYVMQSGGLVLWADYPYVSNAGKTHSCKTDTVTAANQVITVTNYYGVYTEKHMISYVLSTGPLSVSVDSSTWETYQGGVFAGDCGTNTDHAVQVIGLDQEKGYWIVRNSWGSQWGVEGYAYVQMGGDYCDIASAATYVDVARVGTEAR